MYLIYYRSALKCVLFIFFIDIGKQLKIYNYYKTNVLNKYYLFKGGIFYYFVVEDAEYFSLKYNYILASFGNTVKCGFPVK